MCVPVWKWHQSFYNKSLGIWNFSRHAQEFWVNRPCTCLLCQDEEVSSPPQLLKVQDRCWLDRPRASRMGAGCCCPLLWLLPPSLLKGQGWLSMDMGFIPSITQPVFPSPLLVPCLGGFGAAQLVPLCQKPLCLLGSLVMVRSCPAIAAEENDGGVSGRNVGQLLAQEWKGWWFLHTSDPFLPFPARICFPYPPTPDWKTISAVFPVVGGGWVMRIIFNRTGLLESWWSKECPGCTSTPATVHAM